MQQRLANAHPWAKPTFEMVADSDAIYLATVTSSDNSSRITFSITEVLRGKIVSNLILSSFHDNFKRDTEWILFRSGNYFSQKDSVGWAVEGDYEWLPIQVTRDGDKMTADWIGSIDKLREYLRLHPDKELQQPIPGSLKLPNAPKTARELTPFLKIKSKMTMADVVMICGAPDEEKGSGIFIFIYHLKDGSVIAIGAPDLNHLMYVSHIEKSGKVTPLVSQK